LHLLRSVMAVRDDAFDGFAQTRRTEQSEADDHEERDRAVGDRTGGLRLPCEPAIATPVRGRRARVFVPRFLPELLRRGYVARFCANLREQHAPFDGEAPLLGERDERLLGALEIILHQAHATELEIEIAAAEVGLFALRREQHTLCLIELLRAARRDAEQI